MEILTIYISPDGSDAATGASCAEAFASIDRALCTAYEARGNGYIEPIRIEVAAGHYSLRCPIRLSAKVSNLVIESPPGEAAIFSGGVSINEWHVARHQGLEAWIADVSTLLVEGGPWNSLFVDGNRRPRPKLPKEGHYRIESAPGSDPHPERVLLFGNENRFVAAQGDFQAWQNLADVDVVVSHFWIDSRLPVASYDPESRLVTTQRHAVFTLVDSWTGKYARYHLENVGEALCERGEWYLDRNKGTLTYLPLDGETPERTQVVVPRLRQFVRIIGEEGTPVENILIRNIVFEHSDWKQPDGFGTFFDEEEPSSKYRLRDSFDHLRAQTPGPDECEWGNTPQAALHVPGAIHFDYARGCGIENCIVRHTGWYGVSFYEGCQHNHVRHCQLYDLGAGGIVADGGNHLSPPSKRTRGNSFVGNKIENTGHVWPSACGIVTAHSAENSITHNEISDVTYSGISVGWVWGFGDNVSQGNRIEANHVHHLAVRAGLSDLGGIYTLGVQPGTVICRNHIHHVESAVYGGQGIYLDEGSSLIVVEDNLVHHCSTHAFCEHFGRGNLVRNNYFAFCGSGSSLLSDGSPAGSLAYFSRLEGAARDISWPPRVTAIEQNVWLSDGVPVIVDEMEILDDCHLTFDLNVYWDVHSASPTLLCRRPWQRFQTELTQGRVDLDFRDWQSNGMDANGCVKNPGAVPSQVAETTNGVTDELYVSE